MDKKNEKPSLFDRRFIRSSKTSSNDSLEIYTKLNEPPHISTPPLSAPSLSTKSFRLRSKSLSISPRTPNSPVFSDPEVDIYDDRGRIRSGIDMARDMPKDISTMKKRSLSVPKRISLLSLDSFRSDSSITAIPPVPSSPRLSFLNPMIKADKIRNSINWSTLMVTLRFVIRLKSNVNRRKKRLITTPILDKHQQPEFHTHEKEVRTETFKRNVTMSRRSWLRLSTVRRSIFDFTDFEIMIEQRFNSLKDFEQQNEFINESETFSHVNSGDQSMKRESMLTNLDEDSLTATTEHTEGSIEVIEPEEFRGSANYYTGKLSNSTLVRSTSTRSDRSVPHCSIIAMYEDLEDEDEEDLPESELSKWERFRNMEIEDGENLDFTKPRLSRETEIRLYEKSFEKLAEMNRPSFHHVLITQFMTYLFFVHPDIEQSIDDEVKDLEENGNTNYRSEIQTFNAPGSQRIIPKTPYIPGEKVDHGPSPLRTCQKYEPAPRVVTPHLSEYNHQYQPMSWMVSEAYQYSRNYTENYQRSSPVPYYSIEQMENDLTCTDGGNLAYNYHYSPPRGPNFKTSLSSPNLKYDKEKPGRRPSQSSNYKPDSASLHSNNSVYSPRSSSLNRPGNITYDSRNLDRSTFVYTPDFTEEPDERDLTSSNSSSSTKNSSFKKLLRILPSKEKLKLGRTRSLSVGSVDRFFKKIL